MTIKTRIVRVGNSRGIRIPKELLAASGLGEEVELSVEGECLTIRPLRRPREGWEEAFRRHRGGDPGLIDGDLAAQSSWDTTEWEW